MCASIDLDWVAGFIERSGLPPSTVLTVLDGQGIVQYRSVDLEKYVGQARGSVGDGARHRAERPRLLPASTASSACTWPSRWSFADSRRARASRSGSPWPPIARALNAALLRNIVLLVIGTLLCFLIAWLVGEALFLREVRPIIATARKVSAGDLEARTGFGDERGELRELGRVIDDAVAAQQASHRELVARS